MAEVETTGFSPGARNVVAVIATFRRDKLLMRLLDSIIAGNPEISTVYIVDNGEDENLRLKLQEVGVPIVYLRSPGNPGCGAGLRLGEMAALEEQDWEYAIILDDDAVLAEGCVRHLRSALEGAESNMAVPMILDDNNGVTSIPGLLDKKPWQLIRSSTREEFLQRHGHGIVSFDWCPGVCMLVSRRALVDKGLHRPDFWMLGEDLEFSMRMAAGPKNIFVPLALAYHLPPRGRYVASNWIKVKEAAMLLNSAYLAIHCDYCRRLLRHLPGNIFRYLRLCRFQIDAVYLVIRALYWGGILGRTASCAEFQEVVKNARSES